MAAKCQSLPVTCLSRQPRVKGYYLYILTVCILAHCKGCVYWHWGLHSEARYRIDKVPPAHTHITPISLHVIFVSRHIQITPYQSHHTYSASHWFHITPHNMMSIIKNVRTITPISHLYYNKSLWHTITFLLNHITKTSCTSQTYHTDIMLYIVSDHIQITPYHAYYSYITPISHHMCHITLISHHPISRHFSNIICISHPYNTYITSYHVDITWHSHQATSRLNHAQP